MDNQQAAQNTRKKVDKLMAKGDFKAAASLLQKTCQSDTRNAEVYYLLGICLGKLGRWTEAGDVLQQSINLRPDIAQLHFANGIAQQELKQFNHAAESFRCALELDNTLVGAHINLAKTYLMLEDFNQSRQSYQQALQLNPALAEAYYGLGCVEHETGHSEKAIEFFEKTLKHQSNSIDALRMLGSVHEKEGHTEKAMSYYKKALQINPDSAQVAAGLALIYEYKGEIEKAIALIEPQIHKHDHNPALGVAFAKMCKHMNRCEEAVDYIDRILTSPDLTSNRIRKNLHFTVADVLNKLQQYDSAFNHYRSGNDVASVHSYDSAGHMQMINNIISTYSSELFSQLKSSTRHDNRPVFIIGMPRSGTSLTEQILAAHPDVYAAGELRMLGQIINDMPCKLDGTQDISERVALLDQHKLDNMADRYLRHLDSLDTNALRITDKMPHNFYHLGMIQLLFPGVRILHLTRDSLDNGLSIYLQNFSHGHIYANNLFNIGTHYHQYQRLMEHWKKVITLPLLEISYEHLVSDQLVVTRQILEFCGLDWNEDCMQFHKLDREVFTSSYNQVRQPLYKHSVERWRKYERYIDELRDGLQSDY